MFLLLFFTSFINGMNAQKPAFSLVGEYLLEGVMETASGFQLTNDSSFNFFFSYGALDRTAKGTWRLQNDSVFFQSRPKPVADFRLINSTPSTNDKLRILLKEMNPALFRHVYCRIKGAGKEQEGAMDKNGLLELPLQQVDSIEVLFEFCPEKRTVLIVNAKEYHSFEIVPEPWLMEIFFHNFSLQVTKNGLAGGHPLSNKTNFSYRKK